MTQARMRTLDEVLDTSKTGTLSNTIAFSERIALLFIALFLARCPESASQGAKKAGAKVFEQRWQSDARFPSR